MRVASLMLAACVVLGPAGCQVWNIASLAPTATTGIQGNPMFVRLTMDDGTVVNLRNPTIRSDSINGLIAEGQTKGNRIAFPLSHVRQLDRHKVSAGRTAGLVVAIGAVAAGAFFALVLIALSQSGD